MASIPISRRQTAVLALLALSCWLLTHRYGGIWHDALIYNLMAAARLNPAAYANDLFFVFGSQDAFSQYSSLFAWLVDWLGIDGANRVLVLTGAALWVGALILLGRGMRLPAAALFAAVLVSVVTRNSYSLNGDTFRLNESFATARSLAFPLALGGVALDIAGRPRAGVAASFAATLLHPLFGVWALLAAGARRLPDKALPGIGALLLCGFVLLASNAPTMDALWEARVRMTAPDVFAGAWGTFAADRIVFWLSACWLGGRYATTTVARRLCLVVALLAAWAVLLSQVCGDWKPLVFIMQTQPWRAMWLAVVLGTFSLAVCAWRLFSEGRHRVWAVLAITALFTLREHAGVILLALVILDAAGILRGLGESRTVNGRLAAVLGCVGIALLLPAVLLQARMDALAIGNPWFDDWPLLKWLAFGGGGIFFAALAWLAASRRGAWLSWFVAVPLLVLSFSLWDARAPAQRLLEKSFSPAGDARQVFKRYIRPGDVVAGVDRAAFIWFVLGTSGYAGAEQATGSVFSREKTLESLRRLRRVAVAAEMREGETEGEVWRRLVARDGKGNEKSMTSYDKRREIAGAGIGYLCGDEKLDWVVTGDEHASGVEPAAVSRGSVRGKTEYLYDCRRFRGSGRR